MASEFLLAYRTLLSVAENNPIGLAERANAHPKLQDACDRVRTAAMHLWMTERYATEQYAHDVPSHEIAARRDYDLRWQRAVGETDRLLAPIISTFKQPSREAAIDRDAVRIEAAIETADYHAAQFENLIGYARDRVSNADEWDDFEESAYNALAVWDDLALRTRFNLRSVLARLELIPFTLIPSDISKQHGSAETISLFERLGDAQRAFIFGCDLACAALQRSILEDVLLRNYGALSKSLPDRINAARLPWGLKPAELHSIGKLGNDVLHADRSASIEKPELTKRLVSGLDALQKLLEGAPTDGGGSS